MIQEGDVHLFATTDGGDISIENGMVKMSSGLETAVYLSLFGGNEDDDCLAGSSFNWWGNIDEIDRQKHYRSETQNLLKSLPATTGNLRRIEDAVKRDLAWLLDAKRVSSILVSTGMPGINRIKLIIYFKSAEREFNFNFVENWNIFNEK